MPIPSWLRHHRIRAAGFETLDSRSRQAGNIQAVTTGVVLTGISWAGDPSAILYSEILTSRLSAAAMLPPRAGGLALTFVSPQRAADGEIVLRTTHPRQRATKCECDKPLEQPKQPPRPFCVCSKTEMMMQARLICPVFGDELQLELPEAEPARRALWSSSFDVTCPVCEGVHSMNYKEAYIEASVTAFKCLPADIAKAQLH